MDPCLQSGKSQRLYERRKGCWVKVSEGMSSETEPPTWYEVQL
jgi:hypothetical protein